jgi:hypothetical protein
MSGLHGWESGYLSFGPLKHQNMWSLLSGIAMHCKMTDRIHGSVGAENRWDYDAAKHHSAEVSISQSSHFGSLSQQVHTKELKQILIYDFNDHCSNSIIHVHIKFATTSFYNHIKAIPWRRHSSIPHLVIRSPNARIKCVTRESAAEFRSCKQRPKLQTL